MSKLVITEEERGVLEAACKALDAVLGRHPTFGTKECIAKSNTDPFWGEQIAIGVFLKSSIQQLLDREI